MIASIVQGNQRKYQDSCNNFHKIFGQPLRNYFNILTGLDICKLDEEVVKSKDGESMNMTVQRIYGEEGVKIIKNLIF